MKENPYNQILNIISGVSSNTNTPALAIGTILAPPPNIRVSYNGFELSKEEILINEYLLTEHSRTARGHLVSATQNRAGGGGDAAYESHNHDINNDYTETYTTTDTLKPGDLVAVQPIPASVDKTSQQYIILCRLVRADRGNY